MPNVDYLFDWQGNLNHLIETATFDTYQIGTKTIFGIHELGGNLFWINGSDEAYFEPFTYQNKSLGKTRRIGGEASFTTHFAHKFLRVLAMLMWIPQYEATHIKAMRFRVFPNTPLAQVLIIYPFHNSILESLINLALVCMIIMTIITHKKKPQITKA